MHNRGHLVQGRASPPHQYFRDESSPEPGPEKTSTCSGVNGQHFICLHQPSRRHQVLVSMERNHSPSCSCSGAEHLHKSSTHSRAVERVADMLSREGQVLPTEWSLNQRVVEALFLERCYQIQQKCVVFVSPVPDHQACSTDALSMEWDYLRGYAFPLNQSWPRFYRRFGHPGAESF